jgi:tripartite-type tricarboxylate transporter receptor subunit TctC
MRRSQPSRRQLLRLVAGVAALPALAPCAWAEPYPVRPARIVVGFAPGVTPDIAARVIAQWLSQRLGQQFIVENRTGAAGNIATEYVVRAKPDGYTLLLVTTTNAVNTTLYDGLAFDFVRDTAPVAGIMRAPLVMAVPPSFPARTVPEFIAYAKANPGRINMGSAGNGTIQHMAGELFKMMTGIDIVHVPYRTALIPDLLAGQVQVVFNPISTLVGNIQAGQVRVLAVTGTARVPSLPDVPTVAESVPGYEAGSWYGLAAPRNTPPELMAKLNGEIGAALADPAIKVRLAELGAEPFAMTPTGFGNFLADETEKWGKVVRGANIRID